MGKRLPELVKSSIFELKDEGLSIAEISRMLNLHYMTVHYQLRPSYRLKVVESTKRWLERHPHYVRDVYRRRRGVTKDGRVVFGLNRKPRSEVCELCRRNSRRLHFHHWDDSDLNIGLWLCVPCDRLGEALDKGVVEIADEYAELKRAAVVVAASRAKKEEELKTEELGVRSLHEKMRNLRLKCYINGAS